MDRKIKEYNIQFKNAVNLLKDNVDFFYVCPDYFLEQLEKRNLELFKLFSDKNFDAFLENNEFSEIIKSELEKYLEDISNMDKKSYIISLWEDFYDPTAFFTYLMGLDILELREKVSNIDYNEMEKIHEKVKSKQLTSNEALKSFKINKSDFKDYFDRQASDFAK